MTDAMTYPDMIADLRERPTWARIALGYDDDKDSEALWSRIVDVLESVVTDQGVDPEGPNDYSTSEALCGKTEDLLTTWRGLQAEADVRWLLRG